MGHDLLNSYLDMPTINGSCCWYTLPKQGKEQDSQIDKGKPENQANLNIRRESITTLKPSQELITKINKTIKQRNTQNLKPNNVQYQIPCRQRKKQLLPNETANSTIEIRYCRAVSTSVSYNNQLPKFEWQSLMYAIKSSIFSHES